MRDVDIDLCRAALADYQSGLLDDADLRAALEDSVIVLGDAPFTSVRLEEIRRSIDDLAGCEPGARGGD